MIPFFSSTFSTLTACNIYFWIWKYSKFIFMWSTLWSLLVCKIFGQKLPIRTDHHFLESRHPEVVKNLYYVLSSRWSQIAIFLGSSSWNTIFVSMSRFMSIYVVSIWSIFHFFITRTSHEYRHTCSFAYYFLMITWMKNVNNFQIAKVQPQGVA